MECPANALEVSQSAIGFIFGGGSLCEAPPHQQPIVTQELELPGAGVLTKLGVDVIVTPAHAPQSIVTHRQG